MEGVGCMVIVHASCGIVEHVECLAIVHAILRNSEGCGIFRHHPHTCVKSSSSGTSEDSSTILEKASCNGNFSFWEYSDLISECKKGVEQSHQCERCAVGSQPRLVCVHAAGDSGKMMSNS